MSKKVFKWMIADIIFIGVMTLLFLWIMRGIMFAISNEKIKEYIISDDFFNGPDRS